MDRDIKMQYVQALSRFRKTRLDNMPQLFDVNMTELQVMARIADNTCDESKSVDLTEIQSFTYVTKAALSKMFTSLEKKGYVVRETDRDNRRRITVELTENGREVLRETSEKVDQILDYIVLRLGEDNTRQLLSLLGQLSDITDELKMKSERKLKTACKATNAAHSRFIIKTPI